MQKVTNLLFVLVILSALPASTWYKTPRNLFWISFAGYSSKYLMCIDEMGNVIRGPARVSEIGNNFNSALTALSPHKSGFLNYWFILNVRKGDIFRIVIDKETLRSTRLVQTRLSGGIVSDRATLDVIYDKTNKFISFLALPSKASPVNHFVSYPIDDFGHVIGPPYDLSPPNICAGASGCIAGVASDGQLAYWTTHNSSILGRIDLHIQRIGPRNQPILDPVFIDNVGSGRYHTVGRLAPVDATKTLMDSTRLLVFAKQPIARKGSLIIQRLDGKTFEKIGGPITLLQAQFSPGIKIDPKGRFLIFMLRSSEIGAGLAFQALDATGNASGPPKLLSKLAYSGIDLLQDSAID